MTRPTTREWKMGKEFWCRLSPAVPLTYYIRFALHHKCVSVCMVSAETPILKPDMLVLQCGSDTISGSGETLMRYIESRFPRSSLVMSRGDDWDETSWPDSGESTNGGEEVWEELWSSSGGDAGDGIRLFFSFTGDAGDGRRPPLFFSRVEVDLAERRGHIGH